MSQSQGRCETTLAERFTNPRCECPTYPGNLGPCRTWEAGMNGRCVYCDHTLRCHQDIQPARVMVLHDTVPEDRPPAAYLCYAAAPLSSTNPMLRCDRKRGHAGMHSWELVQALTVHRAEGEREWLEWAGFKWRRELPETVTDAVKSLMNR
jgi:hypothetical protein